MRDLQQYAILCMQKLDALHIKYADNISFVVNTRAKRKWGQCKPTGDGYVISINQVLLDERNAEHGLIETLLHELLHTVDGCVAHGNEWQALVQRVNQTYGYNIKRTNNSNDKGVLEETLDREYLYQIQCTQCGALVQRMRTSKFVQHPERYYCARCGGKFVRIK